MAKPSIQMPTAPLRDLLAWWKSSKVSGAIIGGLAVSLVGKPRLTRDVDAVVTLDENAWDAFWKKGQTRHFRSRITDPLTYVRQSRMFVLVHDPSGIEVDISIAGMPFEVEVVEKAIIVKVGRLSVPVARPEDLVIYKSVAGRPQDHGDVSQLLDHHPGIDLKYVRKRVNEFATMLEIPDLIDDLERLIAYHNRNRAKHEPPNSSNSRK